MLRNNSFSFLILIGLGFLLLLIFSNFTSNNTKIASSEISIDADLSDWDSTPFIEGLLAPWDDKLQDETIFDYITSATFFYFYFKTTDSTLTLKEYKDESSIAKGDRVELFFSKYPDLSNYYCAEINPRGEILDYQASFYRKFANEWGFKTLIIASKITENGFIIEGKIDVKELKELGLENDIYLGIFRADFINDDKVMWLSWISPDSKEPDFHIPSAFRKFTLTFPKH